MARNRSERVPKPRTIVHPNLGRHRLFIAECAGDELGPWRVEVRSGDLLWDKRYFPNLDEAVEAFEKVPRVFWFDGGWLTEVPAAYR